MVAIHNSNRFVELFVPLLYEGWKVWWGSPDRPWILFQDFEYPMNDPLSCSRDLFKAKLMNCMRAYSLVVRINMPYSSKAL